MGFFEDLFKRVGSAAFEAAKEHTQLALENTVDRAGHAVRRRFASVPDDVQMTLAAASDDETPEIRYRDDEGDKTSIFLDGQITDEDHERGWAPGHVQGRAVRIKVPSKEEWLRELERRLLGR